MIKKRNGFLRFIFSMVPGVAHMYMGFMKMGISLLVIFFGTIFILGNIFGFYDLTAFLCIIEWLYSFFHVHNLASTENIVFYTYEDKFIFEMPELAKLSDKKNILKQKWFAYSLIILGVFVIVRQIWFKVATLLPNEVRNFIYNVLRDIPTLVAGIGIICLGLYLIRGKKKELDQWEKMETQKMEEINDESEQ